MSVYERLRGKVGGGESLTHIRWSGGTFGEGSISIFVIVTGKDRITRKGNT